jgi:hypothetical protein
MTALAHTIDASALRDSSQNCRERRAGAAGVRVLLLRTMMPLMISASANRMEL